MTDLNTWNEDGYTYILDGNCLHSSTLQCFDKNGVTVFRITELNGLDYLALIDELKAAGDEWPSVIIRWAYRNKDGAA